MRASNGRRARFAPPDSLKNCHNRYATKVWERGAGFSVGQKQLISFARALAFDPRILILDEATSSIDTETEQLIQQAIERLMADRTALVIAHRLSTIQRVNKIIVLHKGEIREMGNHQELLARRGIYYKLYQLQYKEQSLIAAAAVGDPAKREDDPARLLQYTSSLRSPTDCLIVGRVVRWANQRPGLVVPRPFIVERLLP